MRQRKMAKTRLIGEYPVIGIRPTIDGRRGALKVRESLEEQTMNMAKSAAKLIEENVFYSNGERAKVILADSTIVAQQKRRRVRINLRKLVLMSR